MSGYSSSCNKALLEREHQIEEIVRRYRLSLKKRKNIIEVKWLKVSGYLAELKKYLRGFRVAVEQKAEKTLYPIIQKNIAKGTTTVLDCWKAHNNLNKHGHFRKFVAENIATNQ